MKVFISHAAEDREPAALLARQLQSEGLDVWTSDAIDPGDNWARQVGEQLESADFIVFLMTAAGARSEYVRRNVEFAISDVRFKGRVITAIFNGADDRQIPWILRKLVCVSIDPEEDTASGMARVTEAVVSLAKSVCHAD
jgi:hypothetical protein